MDQVDGTVCELCLKDLIDENYQVIGEAILKALALLSLKVSLDGTENYICDVCSVKLFAAFDFKVTCLDIEDRLVSYVESENASQVDLRDAYLKVKQATVTSDHQVCRLCMRIVDDEFKSLRELRDVNMLDIYIPEIDFSITKDPVVCIECFNSLDTYIYWLRWINMQQKIKIEAQDSDRYPCIKNEEINLTLREDNTDERLAKTEPDKISKILSQLRLNLEFPYYLSELLVYNGYDTVQSLALFNDNDLKHIETFGKEVLPDLLNEDEMKKFYGIFIRKPSLFRVAEGHKILLNILIDACKSHCSKERAVSAKSLLQKRVTLQGKRVSHNNETRSERESLQKRACSQESHSICKRRVSQNIEASSEGKSLQNRPTSSQELHSILEKKVSQNTETYSEGEPLQNRPTSSQELHNILKKKRVSQNTETLCAGRESDVDTTTDEIAAVSHIKNIIVNYQRKFLDTLQLYDSKVAMKKTNALQNLQDIKVKIDTKYAIVTCTECGFRSRCCSQLDNGKKKWVLSNFNKHFKTHFKNIPKDTDQHFVDDKRLTINDLQNGRYSNDFHPLNDITDTPMSAEIQQNVSDVEVIERLNQTSNNAFVSNTNAEVCGEYMPCNLPDFLVGRTVVQNLGISSSHCCTSGTSASQEY